MLSNTAIGSMKSKTGTDERQSQACWLDYKVGLQTDAGLITNVTLLPNCYLDNIILVRSVRFIERLPKMLSM